VKISSIFPAAIVCLLLGAVGCGGGSNSSASGGSGQPMPDPETMASPGTLPTPPAQAVNFQNLQNSPNWGSCNDPACSEGSGTGSYWMAQNQTTPSLSGSSMELDNSGAWSDALWWNKLGPEPNATNFLWSFDFQVDNASLTAAQALEFDAFQFLGGYNYMMGTQCDYAGGFWDLWDESGGHWRPTSIACSPFQPGIWHHVDLYTQRSSGAASYTFVTLSVDGTSYALGQSYSAKDVGWDGQVGVQYQLDVNATGQAYQEWVDNVNFTTW
jgi:hypothetical protein